MSDDSTTRRDPPSAHLGCGALILIGLIVLFLGRADTDPLEEQVSELHEELTETKRTIESMAREQRDLAEQLEAANIKLDALQPGD